MGHQLPALEQGQGALLCTVSMPLAFRIMPFSCPSLLVHGLASLQLITFDVVTTLAHNYIQLEYATYTHLPLMLRWHGVRDRSTIPAVHRLDRHGHGHMVPLTCCHHFAIPARSHMREPIPLHPARCTQPIAPSPTRPARACVHPRILL